MKRTDFVNVFQGNGEIDLPKAQGLLRAAGRFFALRVRDDARRDVGTAHAGNPKRG